MTWQDVLTFAVVLSSVAYLGRSAWRAMAKRTGCGTGCGSCPKGSTTSQPQGDGPIIPLDALTRHPPRR